MAQETNSLHVFRVLHRIHRQLTDLEERLARGPRLIRIREQALTQAKARLAQLQEEARRLQIAVDEKQLLLKTTEENIRKRRGQLMQAKDTREYQLLLEQIQADEVANSTRTDEILEDFDRLDRYKVEIEEAKALVAKAAEELEAVKKQVAVEEPQLKAEILRVQKEREEAVKELSYEWREIYERTVRVKGEDALAPVETDHCTGCHQLVPINKINEMLRGEPTTCRACGRLLYLPENYTIKRKVSS